MPVPKNESGTEDLGTSFVHDLSAGTGEASAEEAVKQMEARVLHARIIFLIIALIAALVSAAMGIIVFKATNSLTIEVDDISSWADALSLLVNIIVEYTKVR